MSNELGIPDNAQMLSGAQELLRVWTSDEGERVALRVLDDLPVEAWGVVLADLAQHAARAYAQKGHGAATGNLRAILSQFLLEFQQPTDSPAGEIKS